MKVSKFFSSHLVVGSFAVVLLGGLPVAAANAEGGAERLKALHADRDVQSNNAVSQPPVSVKKEVNKTTVKGGPEQARKFHKPHNGTLFKARGR